MKLVGFLDILGFSDLVNNNSFQKLENIYELFQRSYINGVTLNKYFRTKDGIREDFRDTHIEAIQISDSIVVWTKEDTIRSFYDLIITVREILGYGIFFGLPLRACIHYGEFGHRNNLFSDEISTNTFFGKAITTSYQLCENQSWSGGFLTKAAIKAYAKMVSSIKDNKQISLTSIEAMQQRNFLKKYTVPNKQGKISEELCINWVSCHNPKTSRQELISSFERHNKRINSNRVKIIIENTVKFWESCPVRI